MNDLIMGGSGQLRPTHSLPFRGTACPWPNLDPFEAFFIATDRASTAEHSELVKQHYPHLAAEAAKMGPDDMILSIRRARERLGYAPVHSWRGPEANARVF